MFVLRKLWASELASDSNHSLHLPLVTGTLGWGIKSLSKRQDGSPGRLPALLLACSKTEREKSEDAN